MEFSVCAQNHFIFFANLPSAFDPLFFTEKSRPTGTRRSDGIIRFGTDPAGSVRVFLDNADHLRHLLLHIFDQRELGTAAVEVLPVIVHFEVGVAAQIVGQDQALCVPETMAKEFHLTQAEATNLYTTLYKILDQERNKTKEAQT